MADVKISALPASTTPLAGTEVLPIVQSGVTKQVSVDNLTAGKAVSVGSLTSSGNVGIGTSSPAASLSIAKQQTALSGTVNQYGVYVYPTNSGRAYFDVLTASSSNTDLSLRTYNNGTYNELIGSSSGGTITTFQTAGTERMRLDTSGNLGLGVTPSAWQATKKAFQVGTVGSLSADAATAALGNNVYYNSGGSPIYLTSTTASYYYQNSGQHVWLTAPSGTAGNAISFTQAMTLDASGNLLVGKTTSGVGIDGIQLLPTGYSGFSAAGTPALFVNRNTNDGDATLFGRNGVSVGSISVTTTATAYNTSSDYRLKNITGPVTGSGAYIDSLKPVEGTWKADGSTFVGLIAHEAQEVSRTTVATGVKDGEQMQGMDYSNAEFIANIIAELQSLRARVAQLEGK